MIKKIQKILNIGRFDNFSATGNIELKKITTIYADNGRGKTTLSAILRSLKDNDPIYILERSTLGKTNSPEVEIRTTTEIHKFKNAWDKDCGKIEIFDSMFINKNVFSGEYVEHNHKKNLYRFIIGEKGVELALEVDKLDREIREKNTEVARQSLELQKYIIGDSITIDEFLLLTSKADIKELIENKEKEIDAIKKIKVLISKPILQEVLLPTYSLDALNNILDKQLESISKDAEEKTKSHIKNNLDQDGETWLQKGLEYMNDLCPFCGQSVDQVHLIECFKEYFDFAYKQHKANIVSSGQRVKSDFSENTLAYIQKIFDSNKLLIEFWLEYLEIEEMGLAFDEIEESYKNLRENILKFLKIKYLSPLDRINDRMDINEAVRGYDLMVGKVLEYNNRVKKINQQIQKKKLETSSGDLIFELKELERLKNIEKRYDYAVNIACNEYKRLCEEKSKLENDKKNAKTSLNSYTDEVFKKYQEGINKHLNNFGTNFEISETGTGYVGGGPSSTYCIRINDVSVALGDAHTLGKPCFRNILSQGDKNALAFAFFLSRLEQDSEINNKIVIFDDPVSSLDGSRKICTGQEILKITNLCDQCIVLSHDKHFLRSVFDEFKDKDNKKALQISRDGTGSKIIEWDIISDTMNEYFKDYYELHKFIKNGASDDEKRKAIARCIRPVLEGYLRMKFPELFPQNYWLGQFIGFIDSSDDVELNEFKTKYLQEVKDINGYCKRYHHQENSNYANEPITDDELRAFTSRTIKFIGCS